MVIKKLGIVCLSVLICFSAAGCGEDKEPDPSTLQTPQYSIGQSGEDIALPEPSGIHTAEDGVKVIASDSGAEPSASLPTASMSALTPESVWEKDVVVSYNAFTLPEMTAFDDGSIGVLTISKIGLTVSVYESDDQMEDMSKGAAHFKSTSAWDGNVALSAHNRTASGYGAYFRDLYMLAAGDTLVYKTALGEREYRVTTVKTIGDEDWSYLSRSAENRLTLITCVNDNAAKRLLVQAVQT